MIIFLTSRLLLIPLLLQLILI